MKGYWHKGENLDPTWDFDEQPTLPVIYHTSPMDICGHWHKAKIYSSPCIEFRDELAFGIIPPASGLFKSGDALAFNADDGYFYGGSGGNGTIFQLDPVTTTISIQTTFTSTEISNFVQVIVRDGTLHCLIHRAGYAGMWIQKIHVPGVGASDFVLDGAPLYAGSVVVGTDSKIYGSMVSCILTGSYVAWWQPVTGALWHIAWEELPGSYPYHIGTYGGSTITTGSKAINMALLPSSNYLINSGPESGWAGKSAYIHEIESDGTAVRTYTGNVTTGPNELVVNETYTRAATLRCTGAVTGLTLRVITIGTASSSVDYPITGLRNSFGSLEDNSNYHKRTIWNKSNNLIYSLHSIYPDSRGRIIAVNEMGDLVHQYAFGKTQLTVGSFVILGDYVYVWQNSVHEVNTVSSILKFDLELNPICVHPCEGGLDTGLYKERGVHIISDGEEYIFNYNATYAPVNGLMTKYITYPPVSQINVICNPVWDFTKQPNTYL